MSVDRLCSYFGLTRMPFSKELSPSSLFCSAGHNEAVARLTWCIGERGIATLTGEVGSGKTVALRATVAGLEPSRHQVIYCPNPVIGGRGILAALVTALGGTPRFHRSALVPQAAEALALAEADRGRRVLVAIDEAHLLADDQLEDVRMLTSAELDSKSPLALVLIGQPLLCGAASPRRRWPRSTSGCRFVCSSRGWSAPRAASTSGIIFPSVGAATRSSPTTRSPCCITRPGGCRVRSTTSPSRR